MKSHIRSLAALALSCAVLVPAVAYASDSVNVAVGASAPAVASASDEVSPPISQRVFGIGLGNAGYYADGLTAKLNLGPKFALQAFAGLGWGGLGLDVDALVQPGTFVTTSAGTLNWAVGGGVGFDSYADFGYSYTEVPVAAIFEVNWHFRKWIPVELTVGIRAGWTLAMSNVVDTTYSNSGFLLTGGGAARWYF